VVTWANIPSTSCRPPVARRQPERREPRRRRHVRRRGGAAHTAGPREHDLHLFCTVLAEMARDLSSVVVTPALVGAELAVEVYPDPVGTGTTMTEVKRAALGALVARAVSGSFAQSEVFATFVGVAAVAACPDPDQHAGLYECCDPALGRMAVDLVPHELEVLAGLARQVVIVQERRLPAPYRAPDQRLDRSIGLVAPTMTPQDLADALENLGVTTGPSVDVPTPSIEHEHVENVVQKTPETDHIITEEITAVHEEVEPPEGEVKPRVEQEIISAPDPTIELGFGIF